MTDGTTRRYNDGEVLSGVQRRRRWTPEEKVRIVEETYLPGMSIARCPPARHQWQPGVHLGPVRGCSQTYAKNFSRFGGGGAA